MDRMSSAFPCGWAGYYNLAFATIIVVRSRLFAFIIRLSSDVVTIVIASRAQLGVAISAPSTIGAVTASKRLTWLCYPFGDGAYSCDCYRLVVYIVLFWEKRTSV